jgi:hypothetical protein
LTSRRSCQHSRTHTTAWTSPHNTPSVQARPSPPIATRFTDGIRTELQLGGTLATLRLGTLVLPSTSARGIHLATAVPVQAWERASHPSRLKPSTSTCFPLILFFNTLLRHTSMQALRTEDCRDGIRHPHTKRQSDNFIGWMGGGGSSDDVRTCGKHGAACFVSLHSIRQHDGHAHTVVFQTHTTHAHTSSRFIALLTSRYGVPTGFTPFQQSSTGLTPYMYKTSSKTSSGFTPLVEGGAPLMHMNSSSPMPARHFSSLFGE